ncbi:hypothetical protein RRF57_000263 [Xylaria bambusicola]|uniref:Uncharacterized protein n=1 Tax=Xylaria bambusicola TaxID=326684 RepID=A0AAN7Z0I8_9PEZI
MGKPRPSRESVENAFRRPLRRYASRASSSTSSKPDGGGVTGDSIYIPEPSEPQQDSQSLRAGVVASMSSTELMRTVPMSAGWVKGVCSWA